MRRKQTVEHLKRVFSRCDITGFATKQFKGLLADYIPNQIGLKTRLEIMGQSGFLEKIFQWTKSSQSRLNKIEKEAQKFSKNYGFEYGVVIETVNLVLEAFGGKGIETESQPEEKFVGNFTKTHMGHFDTPEPASLCKQGQEIKKKSTGTRNRIEVTLGFVLLISQLFYLWFVLDISRDGYTLFQTIYWPVGIVIGAISILAIPKGMVWMPLIFLGGQLVISGLYSAQRPLYGQIQLAIWLTLLLAYIPILWTGFGRGTRFKFKVAVRSYGVTFLIFVMMQILVQKFI